MSSTCFAPIGAHTMRLTRLTRCGDVDFGDLTRNVSDGFVSVAVTANYDDGTEVVVTNADGKRCVNEPAEPELLNLSVDITFCRVDPEVYSAVTGFPTILDIDGNAIGYVTDRSVRPLDIGVALETWSRVSGASACDASGDPASAYNLWPYLSGGRIGDYTLEGGNAVTFSVTGMVTRDNPRWGVGPYDVLAGIGGIADPIPLPRALVSKDHAVSFLTTVPAPEPPEFCGMLPLDDPDGPAASGATAGTPGAFTPAGARRPNDLAGMSSVTATPNTAWTSTQYVTTNDGTRVRWSGTAWVDAE